MEDPEKKYRRGNGETLRRISLALTILADPDLCKKGHGEQRAELQSTLNELGFNAGKVDGTLWGKNSANAISSFLMEHANGTTGINPEVKAILRTFASETASKPSPLVQEFTIKAKPAPAPAPAAPAPAPVSLQNAFSEAAVPNAAPNQDAPVQDPKITALDNAIAIMSSDEPLTMERRIELQTALNEAGFDTKGTKGILGPASASAMISALKERPEALGTLSSELADVMIKEGRGGTLVNMINENPDVMSTINGDVVTSLMDHGYKAQLMNAASSCDGFEERVASSLEAISSGTPTDYDVSTTTDLEGLRLAQTLLALTGDYEKGIDGVYGSGTEGAVKKFETRRYPEAHRAQALDVSVHVSKDDIITPAGEEPGSERPLVVIDLGHNVRIDGKSTPDPGAVTEATSSANGDGDLAEIEVIDSVGAALVQKLRDAGYQVAFTRRPGEVLGYEGSHAETLAARSKMALAYGESIGATDVTFISLHANAAGANASGADVFVYGGDDTQSNLGSEELATSIAGRYRIDADEPSSVRHADLSVLRNFESGASGAPHFQAALLEMGFLTNASDAKVLAEATKGPNSPVAQRMAEQITRGIVEHTQRTAAPEIASKVGVDVAREANMVADSKIEQGLTNPVVVARRDQAFESMNL